MKKRAIVCLVLLAAAVQAQDKKISDLTSGSPVQATDMIPIARGGANFRLAGNDFLMWSSGTGDVPATGALGTFYYETDVNDVYTYPSTDTETWLLSLPAASGVSGGIPYFSNATDGLASSALLTANLPVIGGGAGAAPTVGTRSGNSTAYVTTTGTQTSGDCVKIDANGNHIANGSACGGSSAFDPSTTLTFYEDFLSGLVDASGTVGAIGLFTQLNAGTATAVASTAENPGLIRLSSHATTNDSGAAEFVSSNSSSLDPLNFLMLANNDWDFDANVKMGSNGSAITDQQFGVGFSNSSYGYATGSISSGVLIRRNTATLGDTAFVFQVCNASGASGCASATDSTNIKVIASTITPSGNTHYRFRIRRRASGVGGNPTIYMRVNDETEKTFCSSGCDDTLGTLDTTSTTGKPFVSLYVGATDGVISADLDYMYFNMTGLVRY